ncbi:MAG TPA: glycosyltransferase family 9 protein [Gemmatimonadaceae bacterium]|nr:glycosyltransferase family 9 protein [Gemmatimonadaceae bacterium]
MHGLPLVNAIRDNDPSVQITWVVEPMPAGILVRHPSIDRLVVYHRKEGWKGIRRLHRDLRAGPRLDVTLNLNVYLKSAFPTLLSGAPRRLGFDRARAFDLVWLASNDRLPSRTRSHTADMFLEFATYLGIPVPEPSWRLNFTERERADQAVFFGRLDGGPVATIVPASATIKKDWLADRWASVANALEHDFGFRVVLAGGPGEREQAIGREIAAKSSARIHWAMGDSIRRLAWILEGSKLVLAPDTGPVHIARALETPVIGLYAHTNPWRVGPWRAYQDLWVDHYTEEGTAPDPSNRTPKWDRMPTITVDEVLTRVERAVERYAVSERVK